MRSTVENLQLWEQRINERIQSGMTINSWCLKNKISKNSYHYWNQKIRENQNQDSKGIMFADVTSNLSTQESITKEAPHASSDFQLFLKDLRVSIPSNFNSTSLAELMKVLQSL